MYSRLLILFLLSSLLYTSLFVGYKEVRDTRSLSLDPRSKQQTSNIHHQRSNLASNIQDPASSIQHPTSNKVKGASVSVSAAIGSGKRFTLFGYTSPNAEVVIEGLGLKATTTSRKSDGYYEFVNIYAPLLSQEACISSTDTVGRVTSPVCLPPFPVNYNANIGPVILSPSISVEKGNVYIGQRTILTGKTVPNQKVLFSFFKDEKRSLFKELVQQLSPILPSSIQRKLLGNESSISNFKFLISNQIQNLNEKLGGTLERDPDTRAGLTEHWREGRSGTESNFSKVADSGQARMTTNKIQFFKTAEAFSFPELSSTSDKDGNFTIELPTSNQSHLRTFAQVEYDTSPSNKSLTLNIQVLPFWTIIISFIIAIFRFIGSHFIPFVFLIELIIITVVLKNHFFHPYHLAKTREIMLYEKKALMIVDP